MKRIIIVLGATGGHIFPGISIADALRKTNKEVDILFVNTSNLNIGLSELKLNHKLVQIDSLGFLENMIIQINFTLNWFAENFGFREDFNLGIGSSW